MRIHCIWLKSTIHQAIAEDRLRCRWRMGFALTENRGWHVPEHIPGWVRQIFHLQESQYEVEVKSNFTTDPVRYCVRAGPRGHVLSFCPLLSRPYVQSHNLTSESGHVKYWGSNCHGWHSCLQLHWAGRAEIVSKRLLDYHVDTQGMEACGLCAGS